MDKWIVRFLIFAFLVALASALCANTGSHCHDTGCRLNGGQCNSVCVCMQRKSMAEVMYGGHGGHYSDSL